MNYNLLIMIFIISLSENIYCGLTEFLEKKYSTSKYNYYHQNNGGLIILKQRKNYYDEKQIICVQETNYTDQDKNNIIADCYDNGGIYSISIEEKIITGVNGDSPTLKKLNLLIKFACQLSIQK